MISSIAEATGHANRKFPPKMFDKFTHVYVSVNGDVFAGTSSDSARESKQKVFAVKGEELTIKKESDAVK